MELYEMQAVAEGLLFAAGDPVALDKIAEILAIDRKTAGALLIKMAEDYKLSCRGIMIREINGSYQLCTKPQYNEFIKMLLEPRQKQGLSQAAFETLAIIAYNQPITKAKVENIRGVNSDSAITRLLDRNLVKEAGRLDTPGKPILYETTEEFLRVFGFKSIKDMPVPEFGDPGAGMEQESDR